MVSNAVNVLSVVIDFLWNDICFFNLLLLIHSMVRQDERIKKQQMAAPRS